MMRKRLLCTVYGRVHGVMYRDATRRYANHLALNGFVQNQEDGTVFVVAEGVESVLREFLLFLIKGPLLAKVERIEEKWNDATGEFADFQIRFRNFLDHF